MSLQVPDITHPELVTDNAALRELCAQWSTLDMLALDTEFIRVNTFFPKLGLLQVCDDERSYLLDPLSITEWSAFRELLEDSRIIKVLHSCSEDLVVFNEFFGSVPSSIFDTQKAAAFLGLGYSLSYQNLVNLLLGINVPKGETRSDWLRRPLSEEQHIYAALDVAYLPEIYRQLSRTLNEKNRLAWLQQECEQMRTVSAAAEDASGWPDYYLGLGAAWRLNPEQLGALRSLCYWREVEARRRNKPRSWVAKDAELIAIAGALPQDSEALRSIADLSPGLVRHDGSVLLNLVAEGRQKPAECDAGDRPLGPEAREKLKRLQAAVRRAAGRAGIAEELLGRKKALIRVLTSFDETGSLVWPAELGGWRQELLAGELTAVLDNRAGPDDAEPDAERAST